MWIMLKKCGLLLLLWLFALPAIGWAAETPQQQTYITIQTERWNELKNNNVQLLMKLAELEALLATLQTPTSELQQQLAEAKTQLTKSQEALTLSGEKLRNAESLQKETLNSLMELHEKIKQERKAEQRTQARLRQQRDLAWFVAGCLVVYAAAK